MATVSIIGLGPWGLCSLERLVEAARRSPERSVVVHVVEPGRPGGGMYSDRHPDYLVLNTPCGQHSMYPFPPQAGEERLGLGFYEWARERGYHWEGLLCRTGSPDERGADGQEGVNRHDGAGGGEIAEIRGRDFLPRRLMGEYLEWFYDVLRTEAPANMVIVHHQASALDIEPLPDGHERVHLDDGSDLVVDHVILTTGHMKEAANGTSWWTGPYPIETYLERTGPGDKVAVEGMGLVALDVITALTIGLGGRYVEEAEGRLRYIPSGKEPSLYVFSRSGYPYCAKSSGASDPMGDYQPAICTVDAVARLKGMGAYGPPRQLDARRELLPLVFAEMELCYYTRAAEVEGGSGAADEVKQRLLAAWADGAFSSERAALAERYGDFVAHDHFFVGEGRHYRDGEDYQSQVYGTVAADMREALVDGGTSPVKAALETLRALRDTLRMAVEFKGLTFGSHLDFVANVRSRFARLVAGPPVFRSQQLLALVDAGVVKMPFGPRPEVLPTGDGGALLRSAHLEQPCEVVVDRLIRAHLDLPTITKSTSPLLNKLSARGRLRPLTFDGAPAGSVDLTEDFHPVNAIGEPERRLWLFGVLSEGARYFTLYIPSPKSRVRAFLDAEVCANEVVRTGEMLELEDAAIRGTATLLAAVPVSDRGSTAMPAPAGNPVRVALVNNMPDGAFEETERQFRDLLARTPGEVEIEAYCLPGVPRGERVEQMIADGYRDLAELWASPPDALVITGAEPKKAELTEEVYWPSLERLLWWGRSVVPNMVVSCLTAHAALWAFDGLTRRLLLEKCSGVFAQVIDEGHPLMAGVGEVSLPHSRFNEVPAAKLQEAGYRVLAQCGDGGWTVAVGDRGQSQLLLLQGHPEYTPLALFREYRRDIRRYLCGDQGSYPHLPKGYLDDEAIAVLETYQAEVCRRRRGPAMMEGFPFEFAASHVTADWQAPAHALMRNWLRGVHDRASSRSGVVHLTTAASTLLVPPSRSAEPLALQ